MCNFVPTMQKKCIINSKNLMKTLRKLEYCSYKMNHLVLIKNCLPTKLLLVLYAVIGSWDKRVN